MSVLYLCPTPIGNLDDITYRVLDTLKKVDFICAEDTRHSLKLLRHFNINNELISYHEHNKHSKLSFITNRILNGESVAVITDAGTPAISDPGEVLVRECINLGIRVIPLPGATASITALISSGFDTTGFVFEGFLPVDKKKRKFVLERNKNESRTLIFYEAPHRISETLKIFLEEFGNREIAICRELTKIHEEICYTTLLEAIKKYELLDIIKGEFVIVIKGKSYEELQKEKIDSFNNIDIDQHMKMYLEKGLSEKDAMKAVAKDRGVGKRDIYNLLKGDKNVR